MQSFHYLQLDESRNVLFQSELAIFVTKCLYQQVLFTNSTVFIQRLFSVYKRPEGSRPKCYGSVLLTNSYQNSVYINQFFY